MTGVQTCALPILPVPLFLARGNVKLYTMFRHKTEPLINDTKTNRENVYKHRDRTGDNKSDHIHNTVLSPDSSLSMLKGAALIDGSRGCRLAVAEGQGQGEWVDEGCGTGQSGSACDGGT